MTKESIDAERPYVTINKIGGVNMAQLDEVGRLMERLKTRRENIVLVVSAFEGVTAKLIAAMDGLNEKDYSEQNIDAAFEPVRTIHENIIARFFKDEYAGRARAGYDAGFTVLRNALMTHKQMSTVLMPVVGSFEIRDQIIGFGERMAGAFLQIFLEQTGRRAHFFEDVRADEDVFKEGPVTDRSLHEAKKEVSRRR